MGKSKIEWTNRVWNPVTGCTKISPGCQNCYAERMAKRLAGRCGYPADGPFKVTLHSERLNKPIRWRKPSQVFVCSMGDLFHGNVPFEFLARVFGHMHSCQQHTFMVLTKRPERMARFINWYRENWLGTFEGAWPKEYRHVWLGTTCENQEQADKRIPVLLKIPAVAHWVSCEPLLGPVDLTNALEGCGITTRPGARGQSLPNIYSEKINWVICGGESGPGARPMHPDWARSLRDQCQASGVPFFFKQWGQWQNGSAPGNKGSIILNNGSIIDNVAKVTHEKYPHWHNLNPMRMARVGKKKAGRLLDGREWNEMPKVTS